MACLTQTYPFPAHVHEKVFMLLKNKIALWDVVQRCTINGSQDGTINNVIPVNLSLILENSHSQYIFTNGSKAHSLYNQYLLKDVAIEAQKLPSTSPANATYNLEQLLQKWRIIMDYL
jgi:hypoxanthine-DNA glycosylase